MVNASEFWAGMKGASFSVGIHQCVLLLVFFVARLLQLLVFAGVLEFCQAPIFSHWRPVFACIAGVHSGRFPVLAVF